MIRLGTRGSALALAQSGGVADALRAHGHDVELVTITTKGDTSSAAIAQIGGTGVFVTALRDALIAGQVDLAVHSYKDLPTAPADGLVIAAVPLREDPRDVLIARDGLTLGELPAGSRQDHRVELAVVHEAQPGVDVAADRHYIQVHPERPQLRGPPW